MSRKLNRQDLANLFLDPKLTLEAKHEIIQKKLNIQGVDPTLDGEALVDVIFAAYERALAQIESKKRTPTPAPAKEVAFKPPPVEGPSESRKDIIIRIINDSKQISVNDLITKVDDICGYAAAGRSSRTRVNRVIRDLTESGNIEIVNGVVSVK